MQTAKSKNNHEKMMNEKGQGQGSLMTTTVFICLQIVWSSSVVGQPTTIRPTIAPCSRLLMKGIDDSDLPWLQLAGIYRLQTNFTVDFFPVYKHESIEMYFYYNRSMKELRFGTPYQKTSPLVGAYTNGRTDSVSVNYRKPFNPFHNMITGWYQYDPVNLQQVTLSWGKQRIEPTCITDDVVTCSSGIVEFDDYLSQINPADGYYTFINILGGDYYKQIPGRYLDNRPVYTRMSGSVDTRTYLYYKGDRWLIIDVTRRYSSADLKAESSAMRPEHVLGKWDFYTNGRFISVDAKLRCRALAKNKACDASSATQCLNGGTCLTSPDGLRKYCGCGPGYRGLYCEEEMPSCLHPTELVDLLNLTEGNRQYFVTSLYEGSVLTVFRSQGLRPGHWFLICNNRTWTKKGTAVLQPSRFLTLQPPISVSTPEVPYNYDSDDNDNIQTELPRPYTFEWNDTVATVIVAVVVVLMQIVNPLIGFCIIKCASAARANEIEREENTELQNLRRNYQTDLDTFRASHPQPEEEYDAAAAGQISSIHANHQRSSAEITERKMALMQKNKERAKFSRLFSLNAYIMLWIYLIYIILYSTTHLFGGSLFHWLRIVTAALAVVSYLAVLFEYIWSSERQYLKNLSSSVFAARRIEVIRATPPSILFRAECYHYETRTRTVNYRDAHGYNRTSLETYQVKVVTNLIVEPVRFQHWSDASTPELVGINNKGITKIKLTLSVEPGDEETTTAMFQQYSSFQYNYRHSDEFVDFSVEKYVPGFEKRLAAYTDDNEKPIWVSSALFLTATFLCLSWPYRWAFNSITGRTEFTVSKLIFSHHRS